MSEILTALWPVFALLCVGHIIRRIDFPGDGFWEPAEKLIYFLLFPLLLVHKLSLADVGAVPVSDVALAVVLLLSAGTYVLIPMLVWRRARRYLVIAGWRLLR